MEERDQATDWVPSCLEDGSFAPIQCDNQGCWCVLETGRIIPGTEVESGVPSCFSLVQPHWIGSQELLG